MEQQKVIRMRLMDLFRIILLLNEHKSKGFAASINLVGDPTSVQIWIKRPHNVMFSQSFIYNEDDEMQPEAIEAISQTIKNWRDNLKVVLTEAESK